MKKAMWITPVVVIIAAWFFWFSSFLAHHTIGTDFPVFYKAAQAIIDGKSVYDIESLRNYQIPEFIRNGAFIYSLPIVYLMTPLVLLP